MAIYAILTEADNKPLAAAIAAHYPNDHLEVRAGQWLVVSSASAQDVSNTLGVTDGKNGAAVIVSVGSYFGRANPNIWDWIKTKWDSK